MRFTVEELAAKVVEACGLDQNMSLGDYRAKMDRVLLENGVTRHELNLPTGVRTDVAVLLSDMKQAEFLSHIIVTQENPLGTREESRPSTYVDPMEGVGIDASALRHVEDKLQAEASA